MTLEKTYELKNLRLKLSKNEKYLNTAKGEEFLLTEVIPFDQHVLTQTKTSKI